ncbi:toprim domain-containing protein [Puniceicoccales bacterium CK1056]|uniref:Toprim domain-containing protein n=1 Tax=Oceanipulchritudo coccoides TaxID=2706888 RepID=A0A6B2M5C5_9BACT|nr:toprim domain-containing protein [Oceanipulchritudo coccoides]NDV63379.1 toprim domain-containing protein [Oceanipulchritudo coccoides]
MARISEVELKRLDEEVDLVALIRSKGIGLEVCAEKAYVGYSPFTKDKLPAFTVNAQTNQWHCRGSGRNGGAIDFLMKHDGVSRRHAVLLLKEQNPQLFGLRAGSGKGGPLSKATVPKLESPLDAEADDQTLLEQVLTYYQERLHQNPSAMDYLNSRGIGCEAAIAEVGIGFADRTLGLRIPHKNRREGARIRQRLQALGIFRESGHEHFNGCLVFPICREDGRVVQIYGRKVGPQKNKVYHLYLPGPPRGIWNPECLLSPEVILTESVIDALTFRVNGMGNVTCIHGTDGFTDELLNAFREKRTQRVYIAYDRDQEGERAAERDSERLQSIGIECFRVIFPPGQDANEFALKHEPASHSLPLLLNSARWMGRGVTAPQSAKEAGIPCINNEEEKPSEIQGESCLGANMLQESGKDLLLHVGDRQYRVRGLARNTSFEILKVNLRIWYNERYFLDILDLYRAKERERFIKAAAAETQLSPDLLKRDIGRVLLALEGYQERKIQEAMSPSKGPRVAISDPDKKAALELLKSPDLLGRILEDFQQCGIVGETTNKLTGYLAAVSRKLDRPLAVIVQSNSAAGKTALMEAVLAMMPEEERVHYSTMTGQSLYYLGEKDLRHKILAIAEEEGAQKAGYALKLLQSEGKLTIASTGKDDKGRMKTEEYSVEGPIMIFLTTTAIDLDEELLNRCLVLTVDESREQTQAIHRLQRDAETLEGLGRRLEREDILKVHRNAQRLLRPLHVVNPYAPRLTFLSDRTRTRRDHLKYLTLIRSIALLHQYQRQIHQRDRARYIEVELSDIEAANHIAHEILGRSLDDLPPQTRRLLTLLTAKVEEHCKEKNLGRDQCLFTRRQVRQWSGWSEYQVRTHLNKLESLEYLLPHHGGRGQSFVYELLFNGDAESARPQLCGLIEIEGLIDTTLTSSTENPPSGMERTASSHQRAPNGHVSGALSDPMEASIQADSRLKSSTGVENAQAGVHAQLAS